MKGKNKKEQKVPLLLANDYSDSDSQGEERGSQLSDDSDSGSQKSDSGGSDGQDSHDDSKRSEEASNFEA